MEHHTIGLRSGDVDDEKRGCHTDRGFRDVDMEEDGENHRTNAEVLEKVEEKRSLMDIIRTRQKNWIGYILRGNSLQREIMEGRMEGKRRRGRPRQKLNVLDDGGWILEAHGKGTTSRRVESLDIWTCREADHLKKKTPLQSLFSSAKGETLLPKRLGEHGRISFRLDPPLMVIVGLINSDAVWVKQSN